MSTRYWIIDTCRRIMRRSRRNPLRVTLYSRPGCHLCEDARALLENLSRQRALRIEEVDITTDSELLRRYDILIPVIRIEDHIELIAPIREADLRRYV